MTALTAFALDQAHKYWMIEIYMIGAYIGLYNVVRSLFFNRGAST